MNTFDDTAPPPATSDALPAVDTPAALSAEDRDAARAAKRQKAAELIANGALDFVAIAATVGVSRTTLWEWRGDAGFQRMVETRREEWMRDVRQHGIAIPERRVAWAGERHRKLMSIIDQRAADPAMKAVPGGDTGLLVRTVKQIGSGRDAREVEEFAVDTGLLAELRQLENQVAIELGQRVERHEHTAAGLSRPSESAPDYDRLTVEELETFQALHRKSLGIASSATTLPPPVTMADDEPVVAEGESTIDAGA